MNLRTTMYTRKLYANALLMLRIPTGPNLLTNNDAHGGAWIAFNKPAGSGDVAAGGRGGRRGGRRRA